MELSKVRKISIGNQPVKDEIRSNEGEGCSFESDYESFDSKRVVKVEVIVYLFFE